MTSSIGRGAADHLVPRFHVRPPAGYLNDPNGPIVVDGVLHLYFQLRSRIEMEDPVHWGHVRSTDLVHWAWMEPALVPRSGGPDADGCWSGNTVTDPRGGIRAFYSGFRRGHPVQSVVTALSLDGDRFGEPHQAIDDPGSETGIVHFRDPFVWRSVHGSGWRMVVGAGDGDGRASVQLYSSTDLDEWTSHGALLSFPRTVRDDMDTGAMWECPQVAEVAGHEMLLFGAWSEADGTMRVYAVPADGAPPGIDDFRVVDDGMDFYAPSVLRSSSVGPVLFGWAREARSEARTKEAGWSGVLTMPRTITAGRDGRLRFAPVPAIASLRSGEGRLVSGAATTQVGAQFEAALAAPPRGSVNARLWFGDREHLGIRVDRARGTVAIDRDSASDDTQAVGGVVVIPEAFVDAADVPDVRVFVDGSIVEVFTSAGRAATVRVYPGSPPPWTFEIVSATGEVVVWDLVGQADARATRGTTRLEPSLPS